ncbi:substrate-binding periplasmic protein [Shewanella gelidii]|uniref:Solute-binding protein family 3/N-terminal domain-containing protein n=1 Tax=Shewanella gelidii TaxID=1642821 RepID=A0A917JKK2_9GAMM|nr:transporter substrate-binding domain-containing protein [Shewanella gelidii]MCL1096746.1 transporter substrate-binding domain-containing protein [Shewanella gelidii]GGI69908.1 hypothetical protein GCM10009332_03800 [Shewanella gelidii]
MLNTIRLFSLCLLLAFPSHAKKLTVAFGDTLAPWVMPSSNNGILVDMVKEAFKPLGYEVENVYLPYARRIHAFKTRQIDVVCDINLINIEHSGLMGYFSGVLYHYENYFFALSKNKYQFDDIAALKQHSLLSWQGAKVVLGGGYTAMATDNPYYRETHNQAQQVKMLFTERVDVIQLDKNIFNYYRLKMIEQSLIAAEQGVDVFPLLNTNPNGFLFQDVNIRNQFVSQIEKMKLDGRFEQLFDAYLSLDKSVHAPTRN